MVKRQNQRPSGRRRQTSPVPSPKAPAFVDDGVQAESDSDASKAVIAGAPDDLRAERVEADPSPPDGAADEVAASVGEQSLGDEGEQATSAPDVSPPAIAALDAHGTASLNASEDVPLVFAAPTPRRNSLMPADVVGAGATLQAFFLNEGLATLAYWRALAAVKTPAEALRLQVDEIQRAAEASLTCMGRIAGHFGRIANAA